MIRKLTTSTAFAAALLPFAARADGYGPGYGYGYGPGMMGWGGSWHGMFIGPLVMVATIAVVVVVVILLVRWLGGHGHPHHAPAGRTALDILKERFARGEIDKAEFEERRRVLGE